MLDVPKNFMLAGWWSVDHHSTEYLIIGIFTIPRLDIADRNLGKFSLFNNQDAKVFLKLIGILVVPALGIKIIGEFNYQHIKWDLYFLYLVSQFLIYFTGFFIGKLIFKRSNAESLIIGMTSAFSNHLFFVYPIALFEFATKDTTLYEASGSVNTGFDEILEVRKDIGQAGAVVNASRILIKFDLSYISSSIASGLITSGSSEKFYLNLYLKQFLLDYSLNKVKKWLNIKLYFCF